MDVIRDCQLGSGGGVDWATDRGPKGSARPLTGDQKKELASLLTRD